MNGTPGRVARPSGGRHDAAGGVALRRLRGPVRADGIHFTIRLEEDRLCALVPIGVRPDGTEEVVALEDGYRESAES